MQSKIVFIITNSDRAGAQKHVRSLLEYFSTLYEIELISGSSGYLSEWATIFGIKTTIIPELGRKISIMSDLKAISVVRKVLKIADPDIVHLHSAKAGFVGRLANIGMKAKVLYTVHGWAFSEGNSLLKRSFSLLLESIVSPLTDKFILVSNYDYRLAQKYHVAGTMKMHTIHNGVPDVQFAERVVDSDACRVVSLLRFAKQKNVPCMLYALKKSRACIKVCIAGTGPLMQEAENLLDRLGLGERVKLVGEVKAVPEFLVGRDIFILSSDWEGLPIALIEACRAGLAIISTDVGGINEIVEEGGNGYLIPPARPDLMAKALDSLIQDKDTIDAMGQKSRKIYLERFSEKQMLDKTQQVYSRLLEA